MTIGTFEFLVDKSSTASFVGLAVVAVVVDVVDARVVVASLQIGLSQPWHPASQSAPQGHSKK